MWLALSRPRCIGALFSSYQLWQNCVSTPYSLRMNSVSTPYISGVDTELIRAWFAIVQVIIREGYGGDTKITMRNTGHRQNGSQNKINIYNIIDYKRYSRDINIYTDFRIQASWSIIGMRSCMGYGFYRSVSGRSESAAILYSSFKALSYLSIAKRLRSSGQVCNRI